MNVLFITSTFPRSDTDNEVPWLSRLIVELKKKGIVPVVFAPAYQGLSSQIYHDIPVIRFRYAPKFFEILTHEEGAVFKLGEHPWLSVISLFYLCFGLIALLGLRQRRFDVIHVHWPFPNGVFGVLAKRLFRAKLILTFHGAEFSLLRRVPWGASMVRFILKESDCVVANSSYTKKMIQQIEPVNVHVIPFSSAVKAPKTTSSSHPTKIFNVLFVGRFIDRKGISFLIQAAEILKKIKIPVAFDIVGNGPLSAEIQKHIRRLGLVSDVKLHEEIDNVTLPKFYRNCDVFVLPAIVDRWGDTEGLGVVLIEAMSFGKPIVASRVGGIPSVVKNNKNGLLVPQKNPQAIAAAIEKLFRNPKLTKRLGENGLSYARKYYNWETIIDKTIRLYRLEETAEERIAPL